MVHRVHLEMQQRCLSQNFVLGPFGMKRSAPACTCSTLSLPQHHPHLLPYGMRWKQMSTSRFVAHFSVSFSFYSVPHYSALLLICHVSQNKKSVCRVSNPLLKTTAKKLPSAKYHKVDLCHLFFLPAS